MHFRVICLCFKPEMSSYEGLERLRKQFIKHSTLLNKPDVAGWTPLHIAAHMGRRAVVVRLLQAYDVYT